MLVWSPLDNELAKMTAARTGFLLAQRGVPLQMIRIKGNRQLSESQDDVKKRTH